MRTKNELIHDIGNEILDSEALNGNRDWSALSLVASFPQDSKSVFFGYTYQEGSQGSEEFEFHFFQPLEGSEVERVIGLLRQQMSKEFSVEWSQARFRISKPEFQIQTDFEYDDTTRWLPNLEEPMKSPQHAKILRE